MRKELIGEGLVRIGALSEDQLGDILRRQKEGDTRRFGEIAISLGYIDMDAINKYLSNLNE